jgi:hypothetical protein
MTKSQSALNERSKSKDRMQPEGRKAVINQGTELSKQPKAAAKGGQGKPKAGGKKSK